jgi:hypothetical protein
MDRDCATTMEATASATPAEDRVVSTLERYSSALDTTSVEILALSKLRALKWMYGCASQREVLGVGTLASAFNVARALRRIIAASTKWPASNDALICG